MIFCGSSSSNSTSGLVFECLCSPSCAYVQVANLNGGVTLTYLNAQSTSGYPLTGTFPWSVVVSILIPTTGVYQCLFETQGVVTSPNPPQVCPIEYQISDSTGYLALDNSVRIADILNGNNGYDVVIPLLTTAQVVVTTVPYLVQGTGRLSGAPCGGTWTIGGNFASNLRCLKTA